MTAELIIQEDADNFTRKIDEYRSFRTIEEFQCKLNLKLQNYYDNLSKTIFLYRVLFNIEKGTDKHLLKCQYKDQLQCDTYKKLYRYKFFTEQEVKELNPSFEYSILRPDVNSSLIKQNLVQLKDFSNPSKLYLSAIDKLNEGRFERNLLDDLRLCLESLLKELFRNQKSLENQVEELMKFLKERGTSKEIANMFRTLLDYYSKYQNSHIKHNDNVKQDEIDLIINLTSAFISFLIRPGK